MADFPASEPTTSGMQSSMSTEASFADCVTPKKQKRDEPAETIDIRKLMDSFYGPQRYTAPPPPPAFDFGPRRSEPICPRLPERVPPLEHSPRRPEPVFPRPPERVPPLEHSPKGVRKSVRKTSQRSWSSLVGLQRFGPANGTPSSKTTPTLESTPVAPVSNQSWWPLPPSAVTLSSNTADTPTPSYMATVKSESPPVAPVSNQSWWPLQPSTVPVAPVSNQSWWPPQPSAVTLSSNTANTPRSSHMTTLKLESPPVAPASIQSWFAPEPSAVTLSSNTANTPNSTSLPFSKSSKNLSLFQGSSMPPCHERQLPLWGAPPSSSTPRLESAPSISPPWYKFPTPAEISPPVATTTSQMNVPSRSPCYPNGGMPQSASAPPLTPIQREFLRTVTEYCCPTNGNDAEYEEPWNPSDADAEATNEEFLGQYTTQVVGLRFYNHIPVAGQPVILEREPKNAFDTNAIRVLDTQRNQVGHIRRSTAAVLAPLMDQQRISVKGVIMYLLEHSITANISLSVYTLRLHRQLVLAALPTLSSR
jgi:hypothetical protein